MVIRIKSLRLRGNCYGCVAIGTRAYLSGDTRFVIGVTEETNNTLATSTSNDNVLVIDKHKNVGIGVDSPGAKLQIEWNYEYNS